MTEKIDAGYTRKPLVAPVSAVPPRDSDMKKDTADTGYGRLSEGTKKEGGSLVDCLA